MLNQTKNNFEYIEKIMLFCDEPYDYFNYDAVFSDETALFRTPECPKSSDDVSIKIRVGKDNTDKIEYFSRHTYVILANVCIYKQ